MLQRFLWIPFVFSVLRIIWESQRFCAETESQKKLQPKSVSVWFCRQRTETCSAQVRSEVSACFCINTSSTDVRSKNTTVYSLFSLVFTSFVSFLLRLLLSCSVEPTASRCFYLLPTVCAGNMKISDPFWCYLYTWNCWNRRRRHWSINIVRFHSAFVSRRWSLIYETFQSLLFSAGMKKQMKTKDSSVSLSSLFEHPQHIPGLYIQ